MKHFIELMRVKYVTDAFRCENSDFIVSDQRPLVPEFGEPDGERERKRERNSMCYHMQSDGAGFFFSVHKP